MASTLAEESRDSLQIVLPGDLLPATDSSLLQDSASAPVIKLGPGLQPLQDDTIAAVKAGVLKHAEVGNRWWVESNQRRVSLYSFLYNSTMLVCMEHEPDYELVLDANTLLFLFYSMWHQQESPLLAL